MSGPQDVQMTMDRNAASALDMMPDMIIRQTFKGWCQTYMGCDANEEYKIATRQNPSQEMLYLLEEASFFCRCCCGGNRETKYTLSQGNQKGGPKLLQFDRPFKCMTSANKCCCFQEINVTDASNNNLGKVQEGWWCCVPKFNVLRPDGTREYMLQQPTCCGGCCVDIFAGGCCTCRIPFNVYDDATESQVQAVITKVWNGFGGFLANVHTFEVQLTNNVSPMTKARLMAATLLINLVYFESKPEDGGVDISVSA